MLEESAKAIASATENAETPNMHIECETNSQEEANSKKKWQECTQHTKDLIHERNPVAAQQPTGPGVQHPR